MDSKTIDPDLLEYIAALDDAKSQSAPSVFWQELLDTRVAYKLNADGDFDALASRVRKGYGFQELPDRIDTPEADPEYRKALKGLQRMRKHIARGSAKGLRLDKETFEHLRSLAFLEQQGLLDEYLAFLRPLQVRSTMSVARHWYYARQVDRWASEQLGDRPLDVLEIGAGAGNLAVMLWHMGRIGSYTIVDLPAMLVHSAFTISNHVPGANLQFETAPAPGAWTFNSDGRAGELLSSPSFDLCLNFNSFMEMDREGRDGYFDLIYRTARTGALFVNVNRRQPALPLADGSTWDNNPLLYPYRHDDHVIAWEEDHFQTITRFRWEKPVTLSVTSARVVA